MPAYVCDMGHVNYLMLSSCHMIMLHSSFTSCRASSNGPETTIPECTTITLWPCKLHIMSYVTQYDVTKRMYMACALGLRMHTCEGFKVWQKISISAAKHVTLCLAHAWHRLKCWPGQGAEQEINCTVHVQSFVITLYTMCWAESTPTGRHAS